MSEGFKTIDVHSHFILPDYLKGLQKMGVDPVAEDGFPTPEWSLEKEYEFMENAGIDHAVLSLSTPHIYHKDDSIAIELARTINEQTAEICRRDSKHFSFAACLPMPNIEASLKEIAYAYDHLDAKGIKVASNSNGVYLGDSRFDPIFEELNRRKAVITIHPSKPQVIPQNVFTSGPTPLFEYLGDTTRAVINMITNGTIEKYPDIKVIVPHSGSFLPLVIHRLIGISEILIPNGMMSPVDVKSNFKKLYFDIAGDALPLAFDTLLQITDAEHIMYGADFPYTPMHIIARKKQQLLEHPSMQQVKELIFYKNAEKVYQL